MQSVTLIPPPMGNRNADKGDSMGQGVTSSCTISTRLGRRVISSTMPIRAYHGHVHKSSKPRGELSASQVCPSTPWHPGQPHDPVVVGPNPAPCHGLITILSGRADGRNLTLPQLPWSPTLPLRCGEPSPPLSRSWCSLSCPSEELG